MSKSAFKAAKGQDGVAAWVSGTTYAANEIREKDLIFYKSNTQTAQSFIPSEWDIVGVKSAGNTNEVQLTDGIGGFVSDSEFTWVPSINTLNAGSNNTSVSTGNHNFTFGYDNNIVSGDTGMNIIGGNDNTIGRSWWGTWMGELNKSYGGGRKHNPVVLGLSNCLISTGTQHGGTAVGQYNTISGNSTISFAMGFCNLVSSNFSMGFGFNAGALGRTSFVHGDDKSTLVNTPVSQRVLAKGRHGINMSANDTNQPVGYGVLADWAGIFGGYNHHIDIGNTGAVIIGGNTIILTGSSYENNVVVPNLALWESPSSGNGSNEVLVWDTTDKKVKKVSQASIGGSTISGSNGLTKVDSNITLGGTLTGDTTVNTNSYGLVFGTSGSTATGNNSSSFGIDNDVSGIGAMSTGCGNYSVGNYSLSTGQATCTRGDGAIAGGRGIFGTQPVYAHGTASINFSENTVSQEVGHGALANQSAIIGGQNHNIESGNVRAAIIGGNAIKLTGTTYCDTTAVGNLAIFETPQTGTNEDVLVWDEANKIVKKVDQISISSGAFWNTSGTTNVKDTINILDSDTLEFTFNGSAGSTNSLTYNPAASANQGELIISTQNSAANRTTTVSINAQDGFDITTVGSTPINIGTPSMIFNFGTVDTVFTDLRLAGSQRGIRYGGFASYNDLIDDSLITKGFGDSRYLTGLTFNIQTGFTSTIFAEDIGGTPNVELISFQNDIARSVTDYYTDVFIGPSNGNPTGLTGGNIAVGQGNLRNITPTGTFYGDPWFSTFLGDRNIAVGFDVMATLSGGSNGTGNIGIGERVMNVMEENSYNIAMGFHTMRNFDIPYNAQDGQENIAIGNYVMENVTSGASSFNTVIGSAALQNANNVAHSNIVIGGGVLRNASNGVGISNVVIGQYILCNACSIQGTNVMIGPYIGLNVTGNTEEDNVLIGNSVWREGDLSQSNGHHTAVGAGAAWYAGGNEHNIFGTHAGWLFRGTSNSAFGSQSGRASDQLIQYFETFNTPPGSVLVGSRNMFMGHHSGYDAASSGVSDTLVIGNCYTPILTDGEFRLGSQKDLIIETDTTGTTKPFVFTTDGHMGFNTTDIELWQSSYRTIESFASSVMFRIDSPEIYMNNNAYYDGSWKYKTADEAANIAFDVAGRINFNVSDENGIENNEITWLTALLIKNTGDAVFASGITLTTTPTSGCSTQVLTRNSDTGVIEYTHSSGFTGGGGGTVTQVTPNNTNHLTITNQTTTPNISVVTALPVAAGTALATGDQINTFVTNFGYTTCIGDITNVGVTSPITGGNTSGSVTIGIQVANTSQSGYLTNTDWNTFNNKGTGTVTSVGTTSPLTGTVTGSGNLSITQSTTTTDGYLSSTDWNTFNNKGTLTTVNLAYTASATNGIVTNTAGNNSTLPLANGTNAGLLAPAEYTKLNNLTSDYWKTIGTSTLTGTVTIDGNGNILNMNDLGAFTIETRDNNNILIDAGVTLAGTATATLRSCGSGGVNILANHTNGDIDIIAQQNISMTSDSFNWTSSDPTTGHVTLTAGVTSGEIRMESILRMKEIDQSGTPALGYGYLYADIDSRLKYRTDNDTESLLARLNAAETVTSPWTHNSNVRMNDGWSTQYGCGGDYTQYFNSGTDDLYIVGTSASLGESSAIIMRTGTTNFFNFNMTGVKKGLLQIGTTNATTGYILEIGTKGRGTDWTATSDRDLKYNIKPYGEVLPKIDKMDGLLSTYVRKDDKLKQTELGMIAQDVQPIFPDIVSGDKSKGEDLDISYMRMGAISIQGIAELHKKIKDLEIIVNDLKKQINR